MEAEGKMDEARTQRLKGEGVDEMVCAYRKQVNVHAFLVSAMNIG
jgi:hypothetical protein